MIEEHGMCSTAHRGQFFGYFEGDSLQGVALIGHSIIIQGSDSSLLPFAQATIDANAQCLVMIGQDRLVEEFSAHLERLGRQTRLVRKHQWMVCERPLLSLKQLQLRRATMEELERVITVQAEFAFAESGINPRQADWQGFRSRVAERIKSGKVWVKIEDGQMVFKVDIISQSQAATYIEGVWTHPRYRGKGVATTCVSELIHRLFRRGSVVCLIVAQEEKNARMVYEKVGFEPSLEYQTRYFKPVEA
jgi:predicted GNAT family acetyltransferase